AAVISAGTGLGVAGLYWDGEQHHPFASEGGHTDFSPSNEIEIALLEYLTKRFGHVSWERVLSGPGLVNIHQFLMEYKQAKLSREHEDAMHAGDPAVVITQTGLSEQCKICSETLDLFASLYGSEAGNWALKVMATGGVYLGGGIAPKILERLKGKVFMSAFLEKGRMQKILEEIPAKVILNDRAALLGAARFALLDQKQERLKTCSH
ncbi:MAG: glucokinase, partial [Candidatus Omnitrophica bacterium]|nr:glucokinase [Candidatus Omnitrophota bacterium]